MKKYDERETLFSRVELKKGTKEYLDFYHKNPQVKDADDAFRRMSFRGQLRKDDDFKKRFFPLISNNKLFIRFTQSAICQWYLQRYEKKMTIPNRGRGEDRTPAPFYRPTCLANKPLYQLEYTSVRAPDRS